MINKVLIANIITGIVFFASFLGNFIINRKKSFYFWAIMSLLTAIAYYLLNAWSGFLCNLWLVLKSFIILFIHRKKDKIVQSWIEVAVLSIPFVFITIFSSGEGLPAILYNIGQLLNPFQMCMLTDIGRNRFSYLTYIPCLPYNFISKNYIGVISNVIGIFTFIYNIHRIKVNGENKYYKKS